MNEIGKYAQGLGGMQKSIETDYAPRRMKTRDALELKKYQLEDQLKNVNNALDALNRNPNVEEILDLLARV